jgi:hypothetical protein
MDRRFTIRIPNWLDKEVRRRAKREYTTISHIIRLLLLRYAAGEIEAKPPRDNPEPTEESA